jgi:hypothetical protein
MSKAGFSIADLQQGAKKLNTVDLPVSDAKSDAKKGAENSEEILSLGLHLCYNPIVSTHSVVN